MASPKPPRRTKSPPPLEPVAPALPAKMNKPTDRPDSRLSVKRETILRGVIIKGIVATPQLESCKQQAVTVTAKQHQQLQQVHKAKAPQPPKKSAQPQSEPKTKRPASRASMLIGGGKINKNPAPKQPQRPKSAMLVSSSNRAPN